MGEGQKFTGSLEGLTVLSNLGSFSGFESQGVVFSRWAPRHFHAEEKVEYFHSLMAESRFDSKVCVC